jgi:hypothetical protein
MRVTTLGGAVPMPRDCSKCGTLNADEARFCRTCGTALTAPAAAPAAAPPVPCRACGHLNLAGTRFCARCGADQSVSPSVPVALPAAVTASATAPRPIGRWIGLGAVVVALAAGAAWWMNQARSPATPSFDAAPPPAVSEAGSASAPAGIDVPASVAAPPLPPVSPAAVTAPSASAPASTLWEPAGASAATAEATEKIQQAAKDKAARDAKAKALRAQRQLAASQAAAELARRHAEDTRARPVPSAPVPHATAPAAPEPARSVQMRCAGRNAILQGLCEARECIRKENADDAVCQRIRADAERRRQ